MTTKTRIAGFAITLFLLLACGLQAEESVVLARGFKPNSVFQQNEFDTVNTFNGNLMINVPLGLTYKSNGTLSYQFSLNYNSHIWDMYDHQSVQGTIPNFVYWGYYRLQCPSWSHLCHVDDDLGTPVVSGIESVPHGNAGIGWMFSLGTYDGQAYTSQDGTTSIFYANMHGPLVGNPASPPTRYTNDGTYLRIRDVPVPDHPLQRRSIIDFPNGTRKQFTCVAGCPDTDAAQRQRWDLNWISDPFGNVLKIVYDKTTTSETWTFIEYATQHGETGTLPRYVDPDTVEESELIAIRRHYASFEIPTSRPWELRLKKLAVAAPGSKYAVYEFVYTDMPIPATIGVPWPEGAGLIAGYVMSQSGSERTFRRPASALSAAEGAAAGPAPARW